MSNQNLLIWNARGINNHARRSVVRNLVAQAQERVSVLCLQETTVADVTVTMANDLTGPDFDYLCVPSDGASGGILVAWHREHWVATQSLARQFSASVRLRPAQGDDSVAFWLTMVYGPTQPCRISSRNSCRSYTMYDLPALDLGWSAVTSTLSSMRLTRTTANCTGE